MKKAEINLEEIILILINEQNKNVQLQLDASSSNLQV